jgi:hypothetical protein
LVCCTLPTTREVATATPTTTALAQTFFFSTLTEKAKGEHTCNNESNFIPFFFCGFGCISFLSYCCSKARTWHASGRPSSRSSFLCHKMPWYLLRSFLLFFFVNNNTQHNFRYTSNLFV